MAVPQLLHNVHSNYDWPKVILCLFGAKTNLLPSQLFLLCKCAWWAVFRYLYVSLTLLTIIHCSASPNSSPSTQKYIMISWFILWQGRRENQARRQGDFVAGRSCSQTFDIKLGVGRHGCVHMCGEVWVRRHKVLDGIVCVRHETGHRFVSTTSDIRQRFGS